METPPLAGEHLKSEQYSFSTALPLALGYKHMVIHV